MSKSRQLRASGTVTSDAETCSFVVASGGSQRRGDCLRVTSPVHPRSTLDLDARSDVLVAGLEERPPDGWLVSNVSDGGQLNPNHRAIKWFFYEAPLSRTVSYTVTPPSAAGGVGCFSGRANFDGDTELPITGPRCPGRCARE